MLMIVPLMATPQVLDWKLRSEDECVEGCVIGKKNDSSRYDNPVCDEPRSCLRATSVRLWFRHLHYDGATIPSAIIRRGDNAVRTSCMRYVHHHQHTNETFYPLEETPPYAYHVLRRFIFRRAVRCHGR